MNRRDILKWSAYTAGICSLPLPLAVLQSCQPSAVIDWTPTILSKEEALMVEHIANIILPGDATMPPANEINVPKFVDLLIADCLSDREKEDFIAGLHAIATDYKQSSGNSLAANPERDLTEYVTKLDLDAFRNASNPAGEAYRLLKQMILMGYFTSEIIMSGHLNYHAIPGEYKGCIEYSGGDKAYVDNNVAG